jgi:hypothetical protein
MSKKRSIAEHDLSTRGWGNSYKVMTITNGGINIKLAGWRRGIESGDFLILANKGDTTRYKVTEIEYQRDPTDMFFAKAEFSPRDSEEV